MPDNPFADRLPTKQELYYPIVKAIRSLGGSSGARVAAPAAASFLSIS